MSSVVRLVVIPVGALHASPQSGVVPSGVIGEGVTAVTTVDARCSAPEKFTGIDTRGLA